MKLTDALVWDYRTRPSRTKEISNLPNKLGNLKILTKEQSDDKAEKLRFTELLGGIKGIISIIPLLFLPLFFLRIEMYENSTFKAQFLFNSILLAAPRDIAEQKINDGTTAMFILPVS